MKIRQLNPGDAAAYQPLRLEGLQESPTAFGSSYAIESARTLTEIAARLQITADATVSVFGMFADERLVGIAALVRTISEKLVHNAEVCGMYVTPAFRSCGVGRALLDAIIAHARTFDHLRKLKLGVNASNVTTIALYQSRGFTPYGLEHEAMCVDGVFYDEEFYALPLKRDAWPPLTFWLGQRVFPHHPRRTMLRPVTLFTGQWADLPLSELAPMTAEMGYDGLELACWGC
jgi:GNAT superfamily N-acetyltransferase